MDQNVWEVTVGNVSLYRKYRSQSFDDLIGQDHVVRTLQNGLGSGRIAHAFLFTGPRGTGKTSTARLLAKALCCEHGPTPTPDNTCSICQEITAGNFIDVVEMDAASESGVDDIREQIVEVAEYRPMIARYKVFIIDEVHDLSPKAFDALLKTIEEPPPHLIFILATTEFNKVPPTIRSRCQKYEFHRASMSDLVGRLKYVANEEGIEVEPSALVALARMADGGYRDGLTLLEQAILTAEDGKISLAQVYDQLGLVSEEAIDTLLKSIRDCDVPEIMEQLAQIARRGRDPRAILESMLYRLADLTRASYQISTGSSDATREATMHETAAHLGREFILRLRGDLSEAHKVIRDITLPRLWLESELVRLSLPRVAAPTPAAPVATAVVAPKQSSVSPTPPAAIPNAPEVVDSPRTVPNETGSDAELVDGGVAAPTIPVELEGNSPEAVWSRVLVRLPVKDGRTPPITTRARTAKVVGLSGTDLILEVPRKMDADWFTDDPKRLALLTRLVNDNGGSGWSVRVQAGAAASRVLEQESNSVELPAEGDRLAQLAREVFEAG